jgi:transposase-like protein
MKKRFSDEQIVGFLREVEAGEKSVAQVCREGGFSQPTFYVWKKKFGAMGEGGGQATAGADGTGQGASAARRANALGNAAS